MGTVPSELVEQLEADVSCSRSSDGTRHFESSSFARSTGGSSGRRAVSRRAELLSAFGAHCREELDDVVVVALKPARLAVRWRTEETRFELRNGFLGVDRLASDIPTILLGDIESDGILVEAFLDRPDLRSRLDLRSGPARTVGHGALEHVRLPRVVPARRIWSQARTRCGLHAGSHRSGVISLGMG